ncbi:MAG TPA: SEC-C metal-binding domain-containing protein [Candidatus Nanopelagicaceae bacterium]|nr:SEC-C metal-binding domain-containing protein [Candidatus Nanopelagicaceae bacterium]
MVDPVSGRSSRGRQKEQRRRAQSARRRQRRDRAAEAIYQAVQADFDLIYDPEVPAGVAAEAFGRLFPDGPADFEFTERMLAEVGQSRAEAMVQASLADPASPVALTLAADVALLIGRDPAAARKFLEQASALQDAPGLQPRLARVDADQGRLVEAVARADDYLLDRPEDHALDLARGLWLASLAELDAKPAQPCPCGSGRSYADCCQAAGAAHLARFRDRQATYELREAALAYATHRPTLMDAVMAGVDEWVEEGALGREEVDWQGLAAGDPAAQVLRLAVERSLTAPILADDDDDKGHTILQAFAEDSSTPPALARRAQAWADHALWGIWQVEEPGDPGTLISNYLSGTRIYAQIPVEQRDGLRRWGIVLGCFVPVDGVWRSGSAFYEATPAEGRMLAQFQLAFLRHVGLRQEGKNGPIVAWAEATTQAIEELAWVPDPGAPPLIVTALASSVAAVMFPALVAHLRRGREALPQMSNTDGDPIEWIEARLHLTDPKAAREAVLRHPDFEVRDGDVGWLGRTMSASEHAQAQAQLRSQGMEPAPAAPPGRYSRGTLNFGETEVSVTVNSRRRLQTLIELLGDLGQPAEVIAETATDITEELRQRRRWMPTQAPTFPGPEARHAWLSNLADEPHPGLSGLTPRQAAQREEYQDRLEVLLQEIEYQAGPGPSDTDPTGLRQILGLL